MPKPDHSRWTPLVISDHELLHPIASGSYGEVWLARSAVGTSRAVKIVRRGYFERVEDFERAAELRDEIKRVQSQPGQTANA